jgi:hypothetical protein
MTYVKKSCNWVSVVLGAIPDTYFATQLDIYNVDSYDTDLDDKWSHGCCGRDRETAFSGTAPE